MALESLTRFASLQIQMQHERTKIMAWGDSLHSTFIFEHFSYNYCEIPERSKSCICRKDLITIGT